MEDVLMIQKQHFQYNKSVSILMMVFVCTPEELQRAERPCLVSFERAERRAEKKELKRCKLFKIINFTPSSQKIRQAIF